MKILTLVLASALFGAGGVVVKDEVQESKRQEILLAEVAADQRLAAMELDLLRARVEEAERLFQDGLAPEATVRNARLRAREAEIRFARLKLNEEEILLTGREPDDRLAAPLAEGRDFVTERLTLEAAVIGEQREAVRADLARVQDLYRDDLAGEGAVARAGAEEKRLDSLLQEMSSRIDLRQQVLEGRISGPEAEAQMEVRRIRTELAMIAPLREDAVNWVLRAEEMVAEGLAPESHLREARMQLMELETRLELLTLKLEILGRGGGGE